MKSPLRVGFLTARSLNRANGLWADPGVGRIIDALSARFAELHVAMSVVSDRLPQYDHRLELPEERFVALPPLTGVVQGLRQGRATRPGVAELERRCDVVVVQLPFAATSALLPVRRPRVYHVCADIVELVRASPRYGGRLQLPARALSQSIDFVQARLIGARRARLVANGAELHRRYGGAAKGVAVVSATLLDREVLSVPRRRADDAFRVLFVGYLRREKGIDTLAEACSRLAGSCGRRLELVVVGPSELEDQGIGDEIRRSMGALAAKMPMRFEGHKSFGPPLFQAFADADVLVLPSLSEGTPRVLVEARAFGCPVIATRVGGIPTSVTDGVDGLLVPASDPDALTAAMRRVIDEPGLHARLAAEGIARARRHTVEAFVEQLSGEIERAAHS